MEKYFTDNTFAIGNSPLVKINRIAQGLKATILAKVEGRNPAYSVKCRIGASMIWAAERDGLINPGKEIIELLKHLNREQGVTIISATHDLKMLDVSDRIVWIKDGTVDRTERVEDMRIEEGGIEER